MTTLEQFIRSSTGKWIVIPGMSTAECVALFWAFNREVGTAETYAAPGAANLWTTTGGQPYIWDTYDRVTSGYQRGDFLIWSGTSGAYPNGGFGHVAMLLKLNGDGTGDFLSQNPGATSVRRLSLSGVLGALRHHSLKPAPVKPASVPVKPKPKPVPKQTFVTLPATASQWGIYRLTARPVVANIFAYLKPAQFGGLTYKVERWAVPSQVAVIRTRDYGQVQIYVAAGTGARIFQQ